MDTGGTKLSILLLIILMTTGQSNCEDLKPLNIVGFMPITGGLRPAGKAYVPPIMLALRQINSRDDLLSGYNVTFTVKDTQCDPGLGTTVLFEELYTPPIKLMILGPLCSDVAEVQAQASHYFNISHLTFGASTPVLNDHTRFPRFYRISVPETALNTFRINLMKHFNWRKIATISSADSYFSAVTEDLVQKAKAAGIELITQEIYTRDPDLRVQNLKNKDARIIYSGSYESQARLVLCAAYRNGLYGPKVVWMFTGWYIEHWWRQNLEDVPCTEEQMDIVAEGHLLTGYVTENLNNDLTIGGIRPSEFEDLYTQESTYTPDTRMYEHMNPMAYDAVWGCALALNCSVSVMEERGYNKTLDQFVYADSDIGDIMTSCISTVNFKGISGPVKFTDDGERWTRFKIEQIQDTYKQLVSLYLTDGDDEGTWHFEWVNGGIRWAGGVPPRDSTQITMVEKSISVTLYAAMSLSASCGNILALTLLTFNIIYRKHVYVKLSSPNINNVLVFGCILSYSSVYMYSYGEVYVILCKIRYFTFTIGFTTAFGAMFSKTWRVYKIFCNKNFKRVKINDFQLIGIVVIITSVMMVILIIWAIVDPLVIRTVYLRDEMYMTGNDVMVIPFLRDCTSSQYYYFLWTICILEGALLAFGAFLSFETRKVRIAALNDARQVGLCLYNVIILSAIVLTLSTLLSGQVQLVYGIFSGFVLLGTTSTLLIIFIPKIQSVVNPNSVAAETAQSTTISGINKRLSLKPADLTHPSTTKSSCGENSAS